MTMGRCEHCPVKVGACRVETDPRYAASFCRMAEGGEPSQVAAIVAASGAAPEYPSLARQAVSFGKAVASHVANGLAAVSAEEQARRMAICEACPNFVAMDRRCVLCGCGLEHKTWWESEQCPIGKWSGTTTRP